MAAILDTVAEHASPTICFNRICESKFRDIVQDVVGIDDFYRANLSIKDSYAGHECWLSNDGRAGFAVAPDGELINVFSLIKGHGNRLMSFAISQYDALHLNCFAGGNLERFYGQHGFVVADRQPNWTPDEPDVVFMRRSGINLSV